MSHCTTSAVCGVPERAVLAPRNSLWPAAFFALGTFAIGTEGFMIAPLLPRMAVDFGMSVSAVASLVVVFTLVLAFSSPISTVLTGRMNRKDVLLLAMGFFTLANVLAAESSSFGGLLAARIMMAVAAGLYVPNANALAGTLVAPERRGRALAIVSGGMTIAIALGLPLGSLVGHSFGWRATFLAVAVMGMVACAGIVFGVKRPAGGQTQTTGLTERLAVIRQPKVRRLLLVTLFWSMGAYTTYPYIAPYLSHVLSFGERGIGWSVSWWGVFAAVGVLSGGALNDRFGSQVVARASLVLLALAFWVLAAAAGMSLSAALVPVLAAIAVWGFSVWSFFPAQMARLMAAGTADQTPVALSLNTSTMYFGFSIGSALGAIILGTGAIWGIGLAAGVFAMLAFLMDRRVGV